MPSYRIEVREARQYSDVVEASCEADARNLALALARSGDLAADTLDCEVTAVQLIATPSA